MSYIGDLVLATLTFDTLCEESKQPLTVVTAPAPAPLLTADPRVRAVHLVRSSQALVWRVEMVREVVRAMRAGEQIINLELYAPRWRFLRALCRWGSCEARTIDLPSLQADERNALRKAPVALLHRSSYYAGAVGLPTDDPPRPRLKLPPAALARIAERLDARGLGGSRPLVVAHPGSSRHARRAPLPLFAETLAGIAAVRPAAIAVVGNAAERLLAASLLEALPSRLHASSWAGELSLVETAALLARADLFIGSDSGPLKVAEALETPTLSFWGPSAPSFAGPRGDRHHLAHFEDSPVAAAAGGLALLDHPRSGSAG